MATRERPILPLGSGAFLWDLLAGLVLTWPCHAKSLAPFVRTRLSPRAGSATQGRLAAYLGLRGAGEHKVQAPKVELQVHCSNSQTFFILGLSFSVAADLASQEHCAQAAIPRTIIESAPLAGAGYGAAATASAQRTTG